MYWPVGVTLLQNALVMALWLSLPLLVIISLAGIVGSGIQGSLGVTDQGPLIGAKMLSAIIAFAIFGAWMMTLTCHYWGSLWTSVARTLGPGA